jgi:hypothetical protein
MSEHGSRYEEERERTEFLINKKIAESLAKFKVQMIIDLEEKEREEKERQEKESQEKECEEKERQEKERQEKEREEKERQEKEREEKECEEKECENEQTESNSQYNVCEDKEQQIRNMIHAKYRKDIERNVRDELESRMKEEVESRIRYEIHSELEKKIQDRIINTPSMIFSKVGRDCNFMVFFDTISDAKKFMENDFAESIDSPFQYAIVKIDKSNKDMVDWKDMSKQSFPFSGGCID